MSRWYSRHWLWGNEGQWSLKDGNKQRQAPQLALAYCLESVSSPGHKENPEEWPVVSLSGADSTGNVGRPKWLEFTRQRAREESSAWRELGCPAEGPLGGGIPNLRDRRWSWCNSNKVQNKCNAFKASWNHTLQPPVHGKTVFHEIYPWCQKGWGSLRIFGRVLMSTGETS